MVGRWQFSGTRLRCNYGSSKNKGNNPQLKVDLISAFIISAMEINLIGPACAAATFLSVWLGHVSVRKIEREVEQIWIPALLAFVFGIALEYVSLLVTSRAVSAFCGILGVTLLWDALEFYRQQKRIQEGHAPANPNNPRHARILASHPTATTIDWLDRDPRGSSFSADELVSIQEQVQ